MTPHGVRAVLASVLIASASCTSSCLPAHKMQGEPDGRRPPTTRAAFERLEASVPDGAGRAQVVLLSDNTEAWVARWRLLAAAQDRIDVTTFIVSDDVIGIAFLGHLYQKATHDGVKVRLLLDGRGSNSFLTPALGAKDYLQELVSTRMVDARVYNPPVKLIARAIVELRTRTAFALAGTHNKIIIVDAGGPDARAITGGRNIARHYYATPGEDPHGFSDADILVTGAAVDGIAAAMDEDFTIGNREDIEPDAVNMRPRREELLMVYGAMDAWLRGDVPAVPHDEAVFALEAAGLAALPSSTRLPARQARDAIRPWLKELADLRSLHGALVRDPPEDQVVHESAVRVVGAPSALEFAREKGSDEPGDALIAAIRGARRTIAIESPYFVLTPQTLAALAEAAKRGVQIDVVTNSATSTDNPTSASLFLDTWPEIVARVPTMRIFVRKNQPTLHAKRAVFDDALTIIGSYNIDPMSAFVMSELVVAVWSRGVNAQTRDELATLLASGEMLEYRVARDGDGHVRRYPQGDALAGNVVVEFGPRDHVPPDQVASLVAQKDVMIGLRDFWEIPLVVY